MQERINNLLQEVEEFAAQSKEQVEEYRIKWLSKKGQITALFDDFKTVAPEIKKEMGQKLNELRNKAQDKINELKDKYDASTSSAIDKDIDLTLPGDPRIQVGSRHPLSLVKNQIIDVFSRIGFTVSDGREIEDDWHNFTALNNHENHPERDMQDTFYVELNLEMVLSSQTSYVLLHIM